MIHKHIKIKQNSTWYIFLIMAKNAKLLCYFTNHTSGRLDNLNNYNTRNVTYPEREKAKQARPGPTSGP